MPCGAQGLRRRRGGRGGGKADGRRCVGLYPGLRLFHNKDLHRIQIGSIRKLRMRNSTLFGRNPDRTDMAKQSCIVMDKVCYSVGGRKILSDFDLRLEKGENRTILGVSGVGKTTILKLILGLLKPSSGAIFIDGIDISGLSESRLASVRKQIAIVFQGGALFDSMTVGENFGYRLMEEGELSEAEIEAIAREKLGFVGLEKAIDLYPPELSGGMKKRAAIARALAADP